MLTFLIYLTAFVFVLSLVVVVHEGGHFYAARACGVKVTDFSIGFGKELWARVDKKGTRWKICAVPLGGYVKMLGDTDAASATSSDEGVAEADKPHMFTNRPLWQRAIVIAAGPVMNYVFAIVLLTGILWTVGEVVIPPVVGEVMPDSAAQAAGIESGDRILTMNGHKMERYTDLQRVVRLTEFGKELTMEIERNGERLTKTLMPRYMDGMTVPLIGVKASREQDIINEDLNLFQAFGKSVEAAYMMTVDTLIYLKQILFEKRSAADMRGPFGIAEASGDALQGGALSLLLFIVQISIAIGFMNLLPIPVLDGGHLAFYAVEAVIRRPIPEKTQNALFLFGMGILLLILAYTMFLDVPRIMQRILE